MKWSYKRGERIFFWVMLAFVFFVLLNMVVVIWMRVKHGQG